MFCSNATSLQTTSYSAKACSNSTAIQVNRNINCMYFKIFIKFSIIIIRPPPTQKPGCSNGGSGQYCCTNGANNQDCCANGGRGKFCCENGATNQFCCTNGANNQQCSVPTQPPYRPPVTQPRPVPTQPPYRLVYHNKVLM